MDEIESGLRVAARAFLAAAWPRLQEHHVVPPPLHHPYIRVGRDYTGEIVMGLREYAVLEAAVAAAHERFAPAAPAGQRHFPGGYIFSFLETFVARLSQAGEAFTVDGGSATQSIDDMVSAVRAESFEIACCRAVSYMTTVDRQPVDFAGVRVEPTASGPNRVQRGLYTIISDVIPYASSAYSRVTPGGFGSPQCVIVARDAGPRPFDLHEPLSNRIERFLLLVRLLKPGTSESMFEVQGGTHSVREFSPTLVQFRGVGPSLMSPTQLATRVITLDQKDSPRVDGLERLLASAQREQPGMLFTSFAIAMHKFLLSFHAHAWHEQIVDLATAFEATMSGTAKDDVTLRLRMRAATLLATERDPTGKIFADVGLIYGIRSMLVHGGAIKTKDLLKIVRKVSTVPGDARDGEATAHLVERLRDLVRRSLLARICLAAGSAPLWTLDNDAGVDTVMVDDTLRTTWREHWHSTLAAIDAEAAGDRPLYFPGRPSVLDHDDDRAPLVTFTQAAARERTQHP
jgi:hypothetical protein